MKKNVQCLLYAGFLYQDFQNSCKKILIKVHIIHAIVFPWHQSERKAMAMAPLIIPEWTKTNMSAMVSICRQLTLAMFYSIQ